MVNLRPIRTRNTADTKPPAGDAARVPQDVKRGAQAHPGRAHCHAAAGGKGDEYTGLSKDCTFNRDSNRRGDRRGNLTDDEEDPRELGPPARATLSFAQGKEPGRADPIGAQPRVVSDLERTPRTENVSHLRCDRTGTVRLPPLRESRYVTRPAR